MSDADVNREYKNTINREMPGYVVGRDGTISRVGEQDVRVGHPLLGTVAPDRVLLNYGSECSPERLDVLLPLRSMCESRGIPIEDSPSLTMVCSHITFTEAQARVAREKVTQIVFERDVKSQAENRDRKG